MKQLSLNLKNILVTGVIVNVASILFPLISYFSFKQIFLYDLVGIWKWKPGNALFSMPGEWITITMLGNFIMALVFVIVYAVLHKAVPGVRFQKGLWFGFLMWLIGVLIPVFSMYVLLNISNTVLWFLLIQGLAEYLLYGLICSTFYRERQPPV